MRVPGLLAALCGVMSVCAAQHCAVRSGQALRIGDTAWLKTQTTPFVTHDPECQEATCRVFTHVQDFAGRGAITKGPGGQYSNHRGIFVGWADTVTGGNDYDTWAMSNCCQEHVNWEHIEMGPAQQEKSR